MPRCCSRHWKPKPGLHCAILRGAARTAWSTWKLTPPSRPAGRYTLTVTPARVTVAAGDDEALCNGVQTLRQLIEGEGAAAAGPAN